jgi:murein L,D-transpeptidase YafK
MGVLEVTYFFIALLAGTVVVILWILLCIAEKQGRHESYELGIKEGRRLEAEAEAERKERLANWWKEYSK